MVVLAPKSGGNFGISSTKFTTQQTLKELRRAATLSALKEGQLETCLMPHEIAEGADAVLALKVEITSASIKPAEVKAQGAAIALHMIVDLERVLAADQIRPYSGVRKNGSFWYFVGVTSSDNQKATGQLLFIAV
jgi:hypothetical protein